MSEQYKAERWVSKTKRTEVVTSSYGTRLLVCRVDPHRQPDVEILLGQQELVAVLALLSQSPAWPPLIAEAQRLAREWAEERVGKPEGVEGET